MDFFLFSGSMTLDRHLYYIIHLGEENNMIITSVTIIEKANEPITLIISFRHRE